VEDPSTRLLLSTASTWEIAIKHAQGRLALPAPPDRYIPELLRRSGIATLPIELDHSLRTGGLPRHHADPFDRMIVAQAQCLGIPVVSADRQLARYDVDVIVD